MLTGTQSVARNDLDYLPARRRITSALRLIDLDCVICWLGISACIGTEVVVTAEVVPRCENCFPLLLRDSRQVVCKVVARRRAPRGIVMLVIAGGSAVRLARVGRNTSAYHGICNRKTCGLRRICDVVCVLVRHENIGAYRRKTAQCDCRRKD